nr:MAG TPA: hypothetical protein [Caudoviricetes sp.]
MFKSNKTINKNKLLGEIVPASFNELLLSKHI